MEVIVLSPLKYRAGKKFDLVLDSRFSVRVPALAGRTGNLDKLVFGDSTPGAVGEGSWQVWLTLEKDGTLTIQEDYAWDTCSPSWIVAGRRIGTWSPVSTHAASVTHDALYQFLQKGPWLRCEADAIFFSLLRASKFPLSPVYYSAVRVFGGIFRKLPKFK